MQVHNKNQTSTNKNFDGLNQKNGAGSALAALPWPRLGPWLASSFRQARWAVEGPSAAHHLLLPPLVVEVLQPAP